MPKTPVQNSAYLTDHWTTQDYLYFSDFKPALHSIIQGAQTPLTVGVFGPWGSGKTSLMRMLRDELEEKNNPNLRTVWFTAWKYDRQDALWRAFVLRVIDGLYPRQDGKELREQRPRLEITKDTHPTQKAQIELLQRLEESVYQPVEWQELGKWAVDWWTLLSQTKDAGIELAEDYLPVPGIVKRLLKVALGHKNDDSGGVASALHQIQNYRLEQLQHMEQFEDQFRHALREILGNEGRLIVFVDDLDRCLPEKAVQVLEAIKLFLEVEGVVFVLGMDHGVIERGVRAHYGSLFRLAQAERDELPITSSEYMQKIVQIPFHLPPMAVDDVQRFIEELEQALPAAERLDEVTCAVLARGLLPNPRQVKRVLNIFRLLRLIATTREERGAIPADTVSLPLLAKTVVIQTQYPDLYEQWRIRPTLVQTLEAEFQRRPSSEREIVMGRAALDSEKADSVTPEPQVGGLLGVYLQNRQRYALLEQMLAWPPIDETKSKTQSRNRFADLKPSEMAIYVRLAGATESTAQVTVEAPLDLMSELLSGDTARMREAVARFQERETQPNSPLQHATRQALLQAMRNEKQPPKVRCVAGDALAILGDSRFREDAWFLPDDEMLGFVEIPSGKFIMGSDKKRDPQASEEETPQHELDLSAFYIAHFPVTVAQFRASGIEPSAKDAFADPDNHPVRRISWYEAIDYCNWLDKTLRTSNQTPPELAEKLRAGWKITLPSEAEWEKAARGTKGQIYPWQGSEIDPTLANYDQTGIGNTSAVGCFLAGASPFGVEEMAGNVWEWTRSIYAEYSYPSDKKRLQERENLQKDDRKLRVVRGGSFLDDGSYMRAALRYGNPPYLMYVDPGFRVVLSPSL